MSGRPLAAAITLLLYSVRSSLNRGVLDQVIRSKIDPRNILVCHGSNRVIAALLPGLLAQPGSICLKRYTALTGPKRRRPERYEYPAHGGAKPDPGSGIEVDIENMKGSDWIGFSGSPIGEWATACRRETAKERFCGWWFRR